MPYNFSFYTEVQGSRFLQKTDTVRDWLKDTCGMLKCDMGQGNGNSEVVKCKPF
jgi:hypothetical protein